MQFGKKSAAKSKAKPKVDSKPVAKKPEPKPEPIKIDQSHHEMVAAEILAGMISGQAASLDFTKLQSFIDSALAVARQLIESNRAK